ncbi:MAG: hypothetical protein U5N26_08915 [Candidatus Marinimicrobia bacterium]|nr:hypothetical protein [Candidatus Neomarinimicrobiota bacterium]
MIIWPCPRFALSAGYLAGGPGEDPPYRHGSLTDLDTSRRRIYSYIRNGAFAYIKAREAAVMNDTLIYARNAGFRYYDNVAVTQYALLQLPAMAADHYFTRIVPAHLNHDGKFEVIGITE